MRGARPFMMTSLRNGKGGEEIVDFICRKGGLGG